MTTLPEIIIKIRDRIAFTPPEEERFAVVKEYEFELLVNMVHSYQSMVEKAQSELLEAHRRYQTAAELVSKLAGDKRSLMRERDHSRRSYCEAASKLRKCSASEIARVERWNYLYK